ncbi:Eco57I restriction-modification methylase domain-containing protein [Bradyrhizobium sp. RDI18]|uniref:Eco57I restriction-modification methylase domain-containing protein n=1 Tax=Bradyrhizobium sp. RDI18 TaxID=3367400 RepID=UPI00371DC0E3
MLLIIYEEAWADEGAPASGATGKPLRADYPTLEELRKAAPALILSHNLHGVDIDPRCAQIAQLALWMRGQRAFKEAGVPRSDRPVIRRANIVIAEPMPGDTKLLDEFAATVRPAFMGSLFKEIVSEMRLAGEMGALLPIERKLSASIQNARVAFSKQAERSENFLPGFEPVKRQGELDLSGIDNFAFFERAEEQIFGALQAYVSDAVNGRGIRRRLFADDAEQGIAFVETMGRKFDVVLMNPPFGAGSLIAKKEFESSYPRTKNDIFAAFVERGVELLLQRGMLGAITSRTGFFLSSFQQWREEILLKDAPPVVFADLGYGVLDSAMVEVAAYCLEKKP